jgi:hypothetical protein
MGQSYHPILTLCKFCLIFVLCTHNDYSLIEGRLYGVGFENRSSHVMFVMVRSGWWSSFYTLIRVLLVLVLFLANLMKKARNMLLPMHPQATTRLKVTTFHTRGNVLLLYGPSYISGLIFMAPNSLCIPTTSLSSGWWPTISLLVS